MMPEVQVHTSSLANSLASAVHAIDGNLVQLGGGLTNGVDAVAMVQIGGAYAAKLDEDLLFNFRTRQQGNSIGFRAGEPYGAVCYDSRIRPSYVLMSDEII